MHVHMNVKSTYISNQRFSGKSLFLCVVHMTVQNTVFSNDDRTEGDQKPFTCNAKTCNELPICYVSHVSASRRKPFPGASLNMVKT